MNWKIGEAKQNLSRVVRESAEEPQLIFNRDRLVAVVVEPESFQEFQEWRQRREQRSLGEAFAELRALCEEEGYELIVPERSDRVNEFAAENGDRTAG